MRLSKLTTSAAIAVLVVACGGNNSDGATTEVDEATASSALEALHLATSGEGAVSWDERTFDNGVYTFTDVVFTDTTPEDDEDDAAELTDEDGNVIELEDGGDVDFDTVRAERMIVAAPRFDDAGNVIFDRLSIENASFVGEDGEVSSGGFERLLLENPNAAMVADFARGFSGEEMDEDEDPQFSSYRFDNFAFEGLTMSSPEDDEDFEFSLARFAMVDYQGSSMGRFEISGFDFSGTDPEAGEIRFGFDELVMENIGPSLIDGIDRGIAAELASETGDALVSEPEEVDLDNYNPFDAYDSFRFTGLDANIGGVIVTMDSMTAEIDERSDDVIMTSNLTPLVVRPNTEQAFGAQMALGLGMLGYQQIELHGSSEAVYDRGDDRVYSRGDNYFEMTDGFRIETEMDMSGYMAYAREAMRFGAGMQPESFDGEDIMAMFDVTKPGALFHSGSFNNNVFSMNAGVAALSEVLTEEAIARVNAAGDAFRIRLNAALAKADVPLVFSGLGSVAALHIGRTAPERFQAPPLSAEVRSLFHLFMLLEGFWIAERGMIALSLETTQAQMDAFELALARFCARYEALLQSLEAAPAIERAS